MVVSMFLSRCPRKLLQRLAHRLHPEEEESDGAQQNEYLYDHAYKVAGRRAQYLSFPQLWPVPGPGRGRMRAFCRELPETGTSPVLCGRVRHSFPYLLFRLWFRLCCFCCAFPVEFCRRHFFMGGVRPLSAPLFAGAPAVFCRYAGFLSVTLFSARPLCGTPAVRPVGFGYLSVSRPSRGAGRYPFPGR